MRRLFFLLSLAVVSLCAKQAYADTCNGFSNNLVLNCSFETGDFTNWSGTATTANSNSAGVDVDHPYAGQYEAYLGFIGATQSLTQSVQTVPYTTYLIQFALSNDTTAASPYSNSFTAFFSGNTIFSETAAVMSGYTLYSGFGYTTSSNAFLTFQSRNDGGYFNLDSVSVVATTPEPSSWLLLSTGILGCAGIARRRVTSAKAKTRLA